MATQKDSSFRYWSPERWAQEMQDREGEPSPKINDAFKDIRIVNLTPHAVMVDYPAGTATFPKPETGKEARVEDDYQECGSLGPVPLYTVAYGAPKGLPEPQPNTYYIVSLLVAQACPERNDLLVPGPSIRDEEGRVVGCTGLAKYTGRM